MVSKRLRSVLTLTVIALVTFCKTATVAAKTLGAEESHTHDLETLPITSSLGSRRRWPARLLKSAAASEVFSNLANTRFVKWFYNRKVPNNAPIDQQNRVADLFNSHKVKGVNPQDFFKSEQLIKWEIDVKAIDEKDEPEKIMLSTMLKEFSDNVNGGVDAIIAQGLNDPKTYSLALRFEKHLLNTMVDGLQNENSLVESQFVRYVLYRDSDRDTVIRKMQHLLERDPHLPWFSALEKKFFPDSNPYPVKLKSYFDMISGGKSVKDAIKKLGPVNGFNNNAFMLKLLYNKATEGQRSNEEFVNYMLTTLRKPKWSNNKFLSSLRKLVKNDVPYDLRTKLLEPMLTTALKQVKASRSDHA